MVRKFTSNQFESLALAVWFLAVIATFLVLASNGQLGLLAGLFSLGILASLTRTP